MRNSSARIKSGHCYFENLFWRGGGEYSGWRSSCLLLMSSAKSSMDHHYSIMLTNSPVSVAHCSPDKHQKLPTSVVKSINNVSNFCQRTDGLISHGHVHFFRVEM